MDNQKPTITSSPIRLLTVGIIRILREVTALDGKQSPERELVTLAWLLDKRQTLEQVRGLPANPDRAAIIDEYEMEITPVFLVEVKHEINRLTREMEREQRDPAAVVP